MIDTKQFASSVVAGNSVEGDTPEEVSNNALKLYLSALEVAKDYNESLNAERKSKNKDESAKKYDSVKTIFGR